MVKQLLCGVLTTIWLLTGCTQSSPPAQPISTPSVDPRWDRLGGALDGLAESTGLMVGEIEDGECRSLYGENGTLSLALGSSFKLYVLAELARQVQAGLASWDEELPIRRDLKSIPSGSMRREKPGTRFTLRHYARKMIAFSDNTATDHLIHRLGRENVEAMQTIVGHSHPELNIPFLTTREFAVLKIELPKNQIETYLASELEEKREILATKVASAPAPKLSASTLWDTPRYIDTIEWFASPDDLCRVTAWLQDQVEHPGMEELLAILEGNPNLPVKKKDWPYVGFKGGFEPGVLTSVLLMRRADERWFVIAGGLNDSSEKLQNRINPFFDAVIKMVRTLTDRGSS